MNYTEILFAYIAVISAISAIITVYDKISAKAGGRRIPEKTLIILGFLGGAASMLITMLIIRHKTRHLKFMVGLPLEIILHIAIITAVATLR